MLFRSVNPLTGGAATDAPDSANRGSLALTDEYHRAGLILPALALAASQAAILARVSRAAVLDVVRDDFVRTARAKGLGRSAAVLRHALRNAMVPITALMGLQFAYLVAGAVIVENVFSLPGLGRFVFQSIANRDLIVVESIVFLLAAFVLLVSFVADVIAHALDPRLGDVR